MKKLKFIITLILVFVIAGSSVVYAYEDTLSAPSPYTYRNEDYFYQVRSNKTVSILMYIGNEEDVSIPQTIDTLPVTAIEDLSFMGSGIRSVVIPKSITYIGSEAFANCKNLEQVTMDCTFDGKNNLGRGIFRNCTSLTAVTLPSSLVEIGDYMFYGCTLLWDIDFPQSITTVGEGAFAYCINLLELDFSGTKLEHFNDYAFYGASIHTVKLPRSLKSVGSMAFANLQDKLRIRLKSYDSSTAAEFLGPPTVSMDAFKNTTIHQNNAVGLGLPLVFNPDVSETAPTSSALPSCPPETNVTLPTDPPEVPSVPDATTPEGTVPGATASVETTAAPETTCGEVTVPMTTAPMTTVPCDVPSISDAYTPGQDFLIGDYQSFKESENLLSQQAENYKKKLAETLVASAWDVRMTGDANFDGVLNIKDSTVIQKYLAKLIGQGDFNYKNADVNTDGQVNIRDATIIQKRVTNIITEF